MAYEQKGGGIDFDGFGLWMCEGEREGWNQYVYETNFENNVLILPRIVKLISLAVVLLCYASNKLFLPRWWTWRDRWLRIKPSSKHQIIRLEGFDLFACMLLSPPVFVWKLDSVCLLVFSLVFVSLNNIHLRSTSWYVEMY